MQRMGRIYSKARRFLIWLGEDTEGTGGPIGSIMQLDSYFKSLYYKRRITNLLPAFRTWMTILSDAFRHPRSQQILTGDLFSNYESIHGSFAYGSLKKQSWGDLRWRLCTRRKVGAGGIVTNNIQISTTKGLASNIPFNGDNRRADIASLTALKLLQS